MAIIRCPECDREISDKAEKCPHCGYPLKSAKTSEESNTMSDTRFKKKVIFLLALLVFAVLMIMIWL